MSLISEISTTSNLSWEMPKEQIRVQLLSEPCSPAAVVRNLASIKRPIDVYCWYEGSQSLPKDGALFMKESILRPLLEQKQDAKLCLYSLRAWDFKKNITNMAASTPIGEAINRINTAAVECIYSSSFFRYCAQVSKESALYNFINEELPKKEWLHKLSESQRESSTKVSALFDNQPSLFDCIKHLDLCYAYSPMQYIEGYYLIQESVKKGLSKGQKQIEIAFLLPNDEGKYYKDFPKDIERMLQLDFGEDLADIEVNITFQFFQYGESIASRPYIDKRRKAPKVEAEEISTYFDFLSKQQLSQPLRSMPFFRDVIHNLNG